MPDTYEAPKTYGTKITEAGAAMMAECLLNGTKLDITHAAVGDGGGTYCQPSVSQRALINERWRGEIPAYGISTTNPNLIDIKIVVPSDIGGFIVREMGLFSAEGALVAVCNTPDTEKTSIASGSSEKLTMLMHILVADASLLNIVVNPSLDTVSLEDVTQLLGGKQDKLTGQPGQVPVFDENGNLEAQDFSGAAVFAFTAEDWGPPASWAPEEPAEGEEAAAYDGSLGYEIVIPAAAHKRKSGDFGFQVFHQIEGRYITNTWAAVGTGADYDGEAGTVTLSSADPYPGKILFVG